MPLEKPNWLKYTAQYAKAGIESKLLKRKPIFLTVFVTSRCGLNCGHCFYREELLNGDIHKEMKLWEYERFTQQCPSFPKLILTGGEPFLRKDLADIVHLFYHNQSRSRQITIPTAGQHPDAIEALVQRSLRECPELILEIQLSIDGVHDSHDAIRGKGQFAKMMETYHTLRPIQDANERLRIRFNYTFSSQSEDNFEETHQFVTQTLKNPHFDMVLIRRTSADPAFFTPVDMTKYRQATALLQEQERQKASGTLESLLAERAGVERDIISNHYSKKPTMLGCQAGTLTMILSEEGDVRPCEILDTVLGNIRETDYRLEPIWTGQKAKQHRLDIQQSCYCTFETCVRTTMVFQPKWLAKSVGRFVQQALSSGF